MSKKAKGVVFKQRPCKKCKNGYRVCIYHEKNTNEYTTIGANCECERSEIDYEWVLELAQEYKGIFPAKTPALFEYLA